MVEATEESQLGATAPGDQPATSNWSWSCTCAGSAASRVPGKSSRRCPIGKWSAIAGEAFEDLQWALLNSAEFQYRP